MARRPSSRPGPSAAGRRLALVIAAGAGLLSPGAPAPALAGEGLPLERALEVAREAQRGIVRIQWRARRGTGVVERQAVVVDRDGWLLLAGPRPSEDGTLAATFADGNVARAEVWGADPRSALTLLRVYLAVPPARALLTLEAAASDDAAALLARTRDQRGASGAPTAADRPAAATSRPLRLAPGTPFVMVTADGAVARGALRASHRARLLEEPGDHAPAAVTCLDEAAIAVVPTDMGAPWLDAGGRVIGLLVAADVGPPRAVNGQDASALRVRPEITAAYAVPAQVAQRVWPLLRDYRTVPRAALGVRTRPASDVLRAHVCADCGGHEVVEAPPDAVQGGQGSAPSGPSEGPGLQPLDLIRRLEGLPLARDATLADALLPWRPGQRVRLGVLRRGHELDVEVVLAREP